MNPATQYGLKVLGTWTKGLGTGITLGKATFNCSGKPKFMEALIATILCNPSIVKCFTTYHFNNQFKKLKISLFFSK